MMNLDMDSLECDFAETYHIYEMKELPLHKAALFAVGLRDKSRIRLKMNDMKYSLDTVLLANIADNIALLVWSKTEDAKKGINRPVSFVTKLIGTDDSRNIVAFSSADEFEKKRKQILKGGV